MKMKLKIISTEKGLQSFLGESPLMAASIRVTQACNLNCSYCYTERGRILKKTNSLRKR